MKKHFSLIAVILSVLLIVVGYFAYIKFIRPNIKNYQTREVTLDVANGSTVWLAKEKSQQHIYSVEFTVKGNSSENFQLNIGTTSQQVTHQVRLKKGTVDYTYLNDWYSDSCYISITGNEGLEGSLKVEYKFFGLE